MLYLALKIEQGVIKSLYRNNVRTNNKISEKFEITQERKAEVMILLSFTLLGNIVIREKTFYSQQQPEYLLGHILADLEQNPITEKYPK